MQHLMRTTYKGQHIIGLFGFCTDTYGVFPEGFKHTKVFGVETRVTTSVDNSPLVGVFLAGNSNGVITSEIATKREQETLSEAAPLTVLKTRYTALGNLILCNDTGAYISQHLKKHAERISEALDVPVTVGTVAGLDIVGSCGVATNKGVLLHRDATDAEIDAVEQALGVPADIGSVNFGSPYVKSGVIANSTGVLVGTKTTGAELQRIDEALGFL